MCSYRYGDPDCFIGRYYRNPSQHTNKGTYAYDDGPPDNDPSVAGWQRPIGRYPSSWFQDISDHSRPMLSSETKNPLEALTERAERFEKGYLAYQKSLEGDRISMRIEKDVVKCEEELSQHAAVLTWLDGVFAATHSSMDSDKITTYPFTSTIMEGIICVRDILLHVEQIDRCHVKLRKLKQESLVLPANLTLPRSLANNKRDHDTIVREYAGKRLEDLQRFANSLLYELTTVHTEYDSFDAYDPDTLTQDRLQLSDITVSGNKILTLPKRLIDVVKPMKDDLDGELMILCESLVEAKEKRGGQDIFRAESLVAADLVAKAVFSFMQSVAGNYVGGTRTAERLFTLSNILRDRMFTTSSMPGTLHVGDGESVQMELNQKTGMALGNGATVILKWTSEVPSTPQRPDLLPYEATEEAFLSAIDNTDAKESADDIIAAAARMLSKTEGEVIEVTGGAIIDDELRRRVDAYNWNLNLTNDLKSSIDNIKKLFYQVPVPLKIDESNYTVSLEVGEQGVIAPSDRSQDTLSKLQKDANDKEKQYKNLHSEYAYYIANIIAESETLITEVLRNTMLRDGIFQVDQIANAARGQTTSDNQTVQDAENTALEELKALLDHLGVQHENGVPTKRGGVERDWFYQDSKALLIDAHQKEVSRALDRYELGKTDRVDKVKFVERQKLVEFVKELRTRLKTSDGMERGMNYVVYKPTDKPYENLVPEYYAMSKEMASAVVKKGMKVTEMDKTRMIATDMDGMPDLGLRSGIDEPYDEELKSKWKYTSTDISNDMELTDDHKKAVSNLLKKFTEEYFQRQAKRAWETINDPQVGTMVSKFNLHRFLRRFGVMSIDEKLERDGWVYRLPESVNQRAFMKIDKFTRNHVNAQLAAVNLKIYRASMLDWCNERLVGVTDVPNELLALTRDTQMNVTYKSTWDEPTRQKLERRARHHVDEIMKKRTAWSTGEGKFSAEMTQYRNEHAVMMPIVTDSLYRNNVPNSAFVLPKGVSKDPRVRMRDSAFFMSVVEAPNYFHEEVRFIQAILFEIRPFRHLIRKSRMPSGDVTRENYEKATETGEVRKELTKLESRSDDPRVARRMTYLKQRLEIAQRIVDNLFNTQRDIEGNVISQSATTKLNGEVVLHIEPELRQRVALVQEALSMKWEDFVDPTDLKSIDQSKEPPPEVMLDRFYGLSFLRRKARAVIKALEREERLGELDTLSNEIEVGMLEDEDDLSIGQRDVDREVTSLQDAKERLKRIDDIIKRATHLRDMLEKGLLAYDASDPPSEWPFDTSYNTNYNSYKQMARQGMKWMLRVNRNIYDVELTKKYHEELAARAARNSLVGYVEDRYGNPIFDESVDERMSGDRTDNPPRMRGHERHPYVGGQGWFAPTDEALANQYGNGYDGKKSFRGKLLFLGSEMFGPKGAYKNYIVDMCGLDQKTHLQTEKELWESDQPGGKFNSVDFADWEVKDRDDLNREARRLNRAGGPVTAAEFASQNKYRMGPPKVPISYLEFLRDPLRGEYGEGIYWIWPPGGTYRTTMLASQTKTEVSKPVEHSTSILQRRFHEKDFALVKKTFDEHKTELEQEFRKYYWNMLSNKVTQDKHRQDLQDNFLSKHRFTAADVLEFVERGGEPVYGSYAPVFERPSCSTRMHTPSLLSTGTRSVPVTGKAPTNHSFVVYR